MKQQKKTFSFKLTPQFVAMIRRLAKSRGVSIQAALEYHMSKRSVTNG